MKFALYLITLFFAPLAFGTVETWSIAVVELLVFVSLLLFFFKEKNGRELLSVPGIIPLIALQSFILLQLIPLPPPLVHFLAPHIYDSYAPVFELQESTSWIPLTVNQKSTIIEFLRISAYAGFYIITVQLLSQKEYLTKTIRLVAWLGISIAFLAIIQKFTSPDKIYWFRSTPPGSGTVGPWVYHNHYAGFMEMVFPFILALFFYYRPATRDKQSIREQAASLFTSPGSNLHFIMGFGVIISLASVFIALSRGGTLSISLGLFIFLALMNKKKEQSGKLVTLVIVGILLLTITWLGWDPILTKFDKTLSETGGIKDGRLMIWQDCIPMIRDFFVTGSGFGTFIHVYPSYSTIATTSIFDHAHNDYIELLTDGGVIGFGLSAWFVISVLLNGFKNLRRRRDSYSILMSTAGITAIMTILVHSTTDFNMHNGANGLYFFLICGILVSAGNTRLHFRNRPTLLHVAHPNFRFIGLVGAPLFIFTVIMHGGIMSARKQYRQIETVYLNPHLADEMFTKLHNRIDLAIKYDPLEGFYRYYKGNLFSYQQQRTPATACYLDASLKNPMEGTYLQRLALTLPPEDNDNAADLMATGYLRSQNKKRLILTWLEWLLQQNRLEEASNILNEKVGSVPGLKSRLPLLLLAGKFKREEIVSILPASPESWIQVGILAEKMGRLEDAEYFRLNALNFLDRNKAANPEHFMQIYRFYQKSNRPEDGAAILRKGIEFIPDYSPFHRYLGDYYNQQKIPYRAREEYEQALLLDPDNPQVRQQLKNLSD